MDLDLKDKVYLVTGGASGIGEAISELLVKEGANVVVIGRNEVKGKEVVARLNADRKSAPFAAHYINAELSEDEECRKVVDQSVEVYGRIDGLVNNAGKNDGIGLREGSTAAFMQSLKNNLSHYYAMAHYSLPYLIKSKGNIVNISSKTAITGQGGTSAYAAAKGAQLALTREWAVELIEEGIRVNAIIPAEVWTPLYEGWINTFPNPEEKVNSINERIPLGKRMTTSEEIANAALFLLSNKASHITGQHWVIDGGYMHLDRVIGTLKKH